MRILRQKYFAAPQENSTSEVTTSKDLLIEQMKQQRQLLQTQRMKQQLQAKEQQDKAKQLMQEQKMDAKKEEEAIKQRQQRSKGDVEQVDVSQYHDKPKTTAPVSMKQ